MPVLLFILSWIYVHIPIFMTKNLTVEEDKLKNNKIVMFQLWRQENLWISLWKSRWIMLLLLQCRHWICNNRRLASTICTLYSNGVHLPITSDHIGCLSSRKWQTGIYEGCRVCSGRIFVLFWDMLEKAIFCNVIAALFEKLVNISPTFQKYNTFGAYTIKWTYCIVPEYAFMKKNKQGAGRGKGGCVCVIW